MSTGTPTNKGAGSSSESGATDKAKQAATEAKEQSREVAGNAASTASDVAKQATQNAQEVKQVAAQQASQIAGDISTHVRTLAGDTSTQLKQQGFEQTKRAAEGLRQVSDGARALAEGRPQDAGIAGQYVEQAGQKIAEFADRLDSGGLDGLMGDVSRFARRRPGAFLLSAGLLGFAAGRLVRGGQAAKQEADAQDALELDAPVRTDPFGSNPVRPNPVGVR